MPCLRLFQNLNLRIFHAICWKSSSNPMSKASLQWGYFFGIALATQTLSNPYELSRLRTSAILLLTTSN